MTFSIYTLVVLDHEKGELKFVILIGAVLLDPRLGSFFSNLRAVKYFQQAIYCRRIDEILSKRTLVQCSNPARFRQHHPRSGRVSA
jgi:hypothetical protein